jgi:signal peptidase I
MSSLDDKSFLLEVPRRSARITAFRAFVVAGLVGLAFAICACYLVIAQSGKLRLFYASAHSMEPLIRQGERFMVNTAYYGMHPPSRGDVVVYVQPKRPAEDGLKRIVAVGGDRIALSRGLSIVNGVALSEPYADVGNGASAYNNMAEMVVPNGTVFVLGDNRSNSEDSRVVTAHGPVPVGNIIGLATYIVWSHDLQRIGLWIGTPSSPTSP